MNLQFPFSKKNNNHNFKLIGVAGTAGKTVLTHLMAHVLRYSGFKVAVLSSIETSINNTTFSKNFNANKLSKKDLGNFLDESSKKNIDFVLVEVTSSNSIKKTYAGLEFDVLCLSNILQNENFANWTDYAETKLDAIKQIKNNGILSINADDNQLVNWLTQKEYEITKNIYTFFASQKQLQNTKLSINGISFDYQNNVNIEAPLTGEYNVLNLLIGIQTLQKFVSMDQIKNSLKTFKNPIGRLHIVSKSPYFIVIDNAKTPFSLNASLNFLNRIKDPSQKVISIIGSSNLYNPNNKAFGKIAKENSDIVVLTSQDPNNQSVYDINSSIFGNLDIENSVIIERLHSSEEYKMLKKSNLSKRIKKVIDDKRTPFIAFDENNFTGRLDAIKFALEQAELNDIIYINGKGDETSTIYNHTEYLWSDYEAIKIAQEAIGYDFGTESNT